MFPLNWRAHFFFDKYELDERRLVKQCLRADDRVLELGGCIGVVSCMINQMLATRSAHTVIEANPFVLPWLYRNRMLNQCKFEVIHTAVGQNHSESFSLETNALFGSAKHSNTEQQLLVVGTPFSELILNHGPFNVLVMDIEGAELPLLEAAGEWLFPFRLVIFETHPYILGEPGVTRCRQALEHGGFAMAAKSGAVEAWERLTGKLD
jgi:FkbM family methyltransferase